MQRRLGSIFVMLLFTANLVGEQPTLPCHVGEFQQDVRTFFTKAEGLPVDAGNPHDLVLFPEMDARVDVPDFDNYDWDKLRARTHEIMGLAKELSILPETPFSRSDEFLEPVHIILVLFEFFDEA